MKSFIITLLLFTCSATCLGQEASPSWDVRVVNNSNGSHGKGSVISESPIKGDDANEWGLILTAQHVVDADGTYRVEFSNGKKCQKALLLDCNRMSDVAILLVKMPKEINPVEIAEKSVLGKEVDVCIYGRDKRCLKAKTSIITGTKILTVDVTIIPGDSGDAVISGGKLIGIVSAGLRWAPTQVRQTWPLQGPAVGSIRDVLKSAKEKAAFFSTQDLTGLFEVRKSPAPAVVVPQLQPYCPPNQP